jgi:hypothetical protein
MSAFTQVSGLPTLTAHPGLADEFRTKPSAVARHDPMGVETVDRCSNRATNDEMRARWIYSELQTPEGRKAYSQLRFHTPLLEKARCRSPFASLTRDDWSQLLNYARHSSRRGLMGRLSNHRAYRLEHWTKDQMSASRTIRRYGAQPYGAFLAGNSGSETAASELLQVAETRPYYPGTWEPGIAVGEPGDYLLLDGYETSVVFMKKAPGTATFAVWVPDE